MRKNPILLALVLLTVVMAGGCGKNDRQGPPAPGQGRGRVPDLRGQKVLVLPVQLQPNVPEGVMPDAELAFALQSQADAVEWVFPSDVQRMLDRSPGTRVEMKNLPVTMFLEAQVDRIGDPLFGDLRRASALVGADIALIPVEVRYGVDGTYIVSTAILSVRTGRVFWFGVVQGEAGGPEEPQTLASALDVLARVVARGR